MHFIILTTYNMGKRRTLLNILFSALAILAIGMSIKYIFSQRDESTTNLQTESMNIKFNKQGTLSFLSKDELTTISTIDIEVAANDQMRARGLMYRDSMPANAGMLFVFDREDYQGFWMKNTYIALDILFVNANKEIVTIHANTTPLSEQNYASTGLALYVVEVNAGYCMQNNIKEGDSIEFEY